MTHPVPTLETLPDEMRADWFATRDAAQRAIEAGDAEAAQGMLMDFALRMRTRQDQAVVQRLALEMLPAESYPLGTRAVVHGLLAEATSRLEDYPAAAHHARLACAMRDEFSLAFRPTRRVLAYSLYGGQSVYCECAVLNAEYVPEIYPGWVMRVYHDDSVPRHTLDRLAAHAHVELVHADTLGMPTLPGTFWRFFAADDLDADAVVFRDADSVIGAREKQLVDEWLASDKPFHMIRDWYSHVDPMLAGMWGARHGLLAGMKPRIERFLARTPVLHPTHADQHFLARDIWPRIRHLTLQHASVFRGEGMQWPDDLPLFASTDHAAIQQIGSWDIAEIRAGSDQPCLVQLVEGDVPLATYLCPAGEALEVPREYQKRIESGRYRVLAALAKTGQG